MRSAGWRSSLDKGFDRRLLVTMFAATRSGLDYNFSVEKADLRRWVDNRRAAARFEQAHLADAWGTPAQAIAAALSLIALQGRLHGWPAPADPVSDREDQAMWERFARLRARFVRR